jgi:hypothetical protein
MRTEEVQAKWFLRGAAAGLRGGRAIKEEVEGEETFNQLSRQR